MQEFFHQHHTTRTDTSDTEEVPATISCTCRQGPAQLSKALVCSVSFSMNMLECQWYDSMLYKTRSLKNNGYFPEVNSSCFYVQASRESADYNEDNIHQLKSKFQFEAMDWPEVLDPSIGFVFSGFCVSKLMQLATKTYSLMIVYVLVNSMVSLHVVAILCWCTLQGGH